MSNHEISIIIAQSCWSDQQDALTDRLTKVIQDTCDFMKVLAPLEVNVLLTNNASVQELNKHFRGYDQPTNVLSFCGLDEQDDPWAPSKTGTHLILGDIAIAYETVVAEAKAQDKKFDDHLTHMIVHGLLHLLGYDHENDDEAEEMEGFEVSILKSFNIENPYNPINE